MPNWCTNIIDMRGSPADVRSILEVVDDPLSPFDLQKISPMPRVLEATTAGRVGGRRAARPRRQHGVPDWYEWCIANWGTKWNVSRENSYDVVWRVMGETRRTMKVRGVFDTAWSPPLPCVKRLSEMFPAVCLGLVCWDEGVDFHERLEILEGRVNSIDAGGTALRVGRRRMRDWWKRGLDFWREKV